MFLQLWLKASRVPHLCGQCVCYQNPKRRVVQAFARLGNASFTLRGSTPITCVSRHACLLSLLLIFTHRPRTLSPIIVRPSLTYSDDKPRRRAHWPANRTSVYIAYKRCCYRVCRAHCCVVRRDMSATTVALFQCIFGHW